MLKGHGDDLHNFPEGIEFNFSSNVWYGGPPAELLEYLQKHMKCIDHYPEPEAESLAAEIALFHGVSPDHVQVTSGATEAIHLLGRLYPGEDALIITPTFSEYEDACRSGGMKIHFLDWPGYEKNSPLFSLKNGEKVTESLSSWLSLLEKKIQRISPRIVFLCNPNNPGGEYIPSEELIPVLQTFPEITFVVDEAYLGFLEDRKSVFDSKGNNSRLVVVKSLTKTFGIPGLRLGYMLGDPGVLQMVRGLRYPWSVSAPAILAGKWIVENRLRPEFDTAALLREGWELARAVDEIPGFSVRYSSTHYFLVRMEEFSSGELKRHLANQDRILIRDASNFRGLSERWFRICSRSSPENRRLVEALKNFQNRQQG